MKIKHHGAIDGVTGSCHELQLADGRSLLIDCGLFQGAEAGPRRDAGLRSCLTMLHEMLQTLSNMACKAP